MIGAAIMSIVLLSLAGVMTGPFAVDLGFSRNEYASIIKVVGLAALLALAPGVSEAAPDSRVDAAAPTPPVAAALAARRAGSSGRGGSAPGCLAVAAAG